MSKYQSKASMQDENKYLDYVIDPSFEEANKRFVLSFKDNVVKTGNTGCIVPLVETKY